MSGCKNFYRILGLEKTASEADIKKAYRSLALIHHPDKGGDSEKFKEINQAYEALNPPKKEALNPSNSISAQKSRMEQAKAQRKKDAQEAQAFLEARAAARAEKAAEARKAAKAAWQAERSKGNSETRGSKPRRASAQASHHAPADPVVQKAPAAAKVSKHEEDPFWSLFSVFEDAPPEDEMQERAPPAEEEDPFWSFFRMLGTVYGCCTQRELWRVGRIFFEIWNARDLKDAWLVDRTSVFHPTSLAYMLECWIWRKTFHFDHTSWRWALPIPNWPNEVDQNSKAFEVDSRLWWPSRGGCSIDWTQQWSPEQKESEVHNLQRWIPSGVIAVPQEVDPATAADRLALQVREIWM